MNNKIVNELNENDLIVLARLLKLYSCISNNYKDNKFDEINTVDNIRNKIINLIEKNTEYK